MPKVSLNSDLRTCWLFTWWTVGFFWQIEDGEIYATVNQRDGMVSFQDNPEKYNSVRMLTKLDEEVTGSVTITT